MKARAFLFTLLMFALTNIASVASPASAQGIVRGIVTGPDGKPLGKQPVVLHRVTGSAGLTVATGESAADGSFTLRISDPTASADAVYFLAARYKKDGELYLGDAFKAPFDTSVSHTVQVGVSATSARALITGANAEQAMPQTPQAPPPPDPTRWLVIVMPVLALLALSVMLFGTRGRIPARRRTLLEIATLDESNANASTSAPDYMSRRAALIAQLNTPAEV